MIKSKKQMYFVIASFALVLLLGTVTYAFFNYTRTGSANVVKTGRIAFNSEQGTSINLTNVFPIDVTNGIPSNNPNVGSVTINVTGDTTYGEGLEYKVSAVNVTNTVGNKSLPISISVSVESNTNNDPSTTLGTADSDYFTNRGPSANTSIYKVLASDVIEENEELLVGYIKPGATGIDGNIVIKAYLDASKIAISDTYPEETIHTVKTNNYSSSDCETALTGVTGAATYCASASALQDAIDNEYLDETQVGLLVTAGIVEEYTNGTTSSWVNGREVFTTEEWNSLQSSGVSFQIRVEANEGVWVQQTAADFIGSLNTLETVPYGKIYTGSTPDNYVTFNNNEKWRIIGVYGDNLKIIKATPLEPRRTYNSSVNNGNAWAGSELEIYLNQETEGGYYYSIDETSKDMIEAGTWNAGAVAHNLTALEAYTLAQNNEVSNKKVGLIASYEYLYAAGSNCQNVAGNSFNTTCSSNDWLTPNDYPMWTLSPFSEFNQLSITVYDYVSPNSVVNGDDVYPVVYLKSSVTIDDGDGSYERPYNLSYSE